VRKHTLEEDSSRSALSPANLADIPPNIVAAQAIKEVLRAARDGESKEGRSSIVDKTAPQWIQATLADKEILEEGIAPPEPPSPPPMPRASTRPLPIPRMTTMPGLNPERTLEYKCHGGVTTVRLRAVIDFGVDEVMKLLLDTKRTKDWNVKHHRSQLVHSISSKLDLIHEVFKGFSSPYKYRDFALLRTWDELPNGGRVIAHRSIMTQKIPEQKDLRRAVLLPTGYLLEPLAARESSQETKDDVDPPPPEVTEITFIAQMTRESVLLVTPDLLGETTELIDSMKNINKVLTKEAREKYVKSTRSMRAPKA